MIKKPFITPLPILLALLLSTSGCLRKAIDKDGTVEIEGANKFKFLFQPANAIADKQLAPAVGIVVMDAEGNILKNAIGSVTLSLKSNPNQGTLTGGGTYPLINGLATFSTLSIDQIGAGYSLVASGEGINSSSSYSFNVTGILNLKGPTSPLSTACALYTVSLVDGNGDLAQAAADTTVYLDRDGPSTFVATTDTCSDVLGVPISQVTIPKGGHFAQFYLRPASESNTQWGLTSSNAWIAPEASLGPIITTNTSPVAAGTPDASFHAGDGIVSSTIPSATVGSGAVSMMALAPDGKIVLLKAYYKIGNVLPTSALSRWNENGALDTSFGSSGTAFILPNHYFIPFSLAIQNDSKIIVAGALISLDTYYYSYAMIRLKANGQVDSDDFGDSGLVTSNYENLGNTNDRANAIVVQKDGKILLAGTSTQLARPGEISFSVFRYNEDGSPDTSFNQTGEVIKTNSDYPYSMAFAVAVDSKNRIVLAGISQDTSYNNYFTMIRYLSSGQIDASFGTDGVALTNILVSAGNYISVAIGVDGKILATLDGDGGYLTLVRFKSSGEIDSDTGSFGTAGVVETSLISNLTSGLGQIYSSMALAPDGKILLAGAYQSSRNDFKVQRFLSDGTLDSTSFGNAGSYSTTGLTKTLASSDVPTSVKIAPDGKVVVGGLATAINNSYLATLLLRLWP
jgi:uncharacterized delta-60 repeat protein